MATVTEMVMQDAAASIETSYMMAAGDMFMGTIDPGDEDWVGIELAEGNMYTITVGGGDAAMGQLNDSVLQLLDSKGTVIMMNDDKDGGMGDLSSEIKFTSGDRQRYAGVLHQCQRQWRQPRVTRSPAATRSMSWRWRCRRKARERTLKLPVMPTTSSPVLLTESPSPVWGGNDILVGGGGDDTLARRRR